MSVSVDGERTYKLGKMRLSLIKSWHVVAFQGPRGSGKTTAMKNVMRADYDYDRVLVFSPSETSSGDLGSHVPNTFIHEDFYEEILDELIIMQRRSKAMHLRDPDRYPLRKAAVIFEDCMYSKKVKSSKLVRWLLMNGRHDNIKVLISSQYMMDLGPDLRSNIDWLILTFDSSRKNRRRLFEDYFSCVDELDVFNDIMDRYTTNHGALCLWQSSKHSRLDMRLFTWKPQYELGHWYFGNRSVWKWHYMFRDVRSNRTKADLTDEKLSVLAQLESKPSDRRRSRGSSSAGGGRSKKGNYRIVS